jgi:hypothetical protein
MKKVMLVLVLGIFTFSTLSYTTIEKSKNEARGSSACVQEASELTLMLAEAAGQHPSDNWENYWYHVYMYHYTGCLQR